MASPGLTRGRADVGPPRIKDVAALAGVSTATVSRALSGNGQVSTKARTRVQQAARDLGFVMSYHASSLATGRSRTIGIVLPYIDRWYFSAVLEGAAGAMIEAGYDLSLYNFEGDQYRETVLTDFLLRKRLDAAIAVSLHLNDHETEQLFSAGIPLVGIGGRIAGVDSIYIDEHAAGRRATDHLIGLGHRRIAHLGGVHEHGRQFKPSTDRRAGYLDALQAAGIPADPDYSLIADFTLNDAYQQTKNLLAEPRNRPTGIFSASDEMAMGAILAARELNIRVPAELSVVSIDGHPNGESFGLTTIDQHTHDQGAKAVARILQQLSGDTADMPDDPLPLDFIVRSSTAPPQEAARR
ncbi:LacI family DNA-binding transcriptional regulator [Arthrobacter sp. Hz1]